jgi:hypothetical protein
MEDMKINTTDYGVCDVSKGYYPSNGNMWLVLTDADGQQVTVITSNIIPMADGEFCGNITNIGKTLWDDILASGLIEETGEKVPSGYVLFPVCKLVKEIA